MRVTRSSPTVPSPPRSPPRGERRCSCACPARTTRSTRPARSPCWPASATSRRTPSARSRASAGTERRFELHGTVGGVSVYDDYAHHPTEVARRARGPRTVVRIRPDHRGAPAAPLLPHPACSQEFAEVLETYADHTVVLDVYGAREDPVPGVTGALVADRFARSRPRGLHRGLAAGRGPHRDGRPRGRLRDHPRLRRRLPDRPAAARGAPRDRRGLIVRRPSPIRPGAADRAGGAGARGCAAPRSLASVARGCAPPRRGFREDVAPQRPAAPIPLDPCVPARRRARRRPIAAGERTRAGGRSAHRHADQWHAPRGRGERAWSAARSAGSPSAPGAAASAGLVAGARRGAGRRRERWRRVLARSSPLRTHHGRRARARSRRPTCRRPCPTSSARRSRSSTERRERQRPRRRSR